MQFSDNGGMLITALPVCRRFRRAEQFSDLQRALQAGLQATAWNCPPTQSALHDGDTRDQRATGRDIHRPTSVLESAQRRRISRRQALVQGRC
jgi:hypothetical protein